MCIQCMSLIGAPPTAQDSPLELAIPLIVFMNMGGGQRGDLPNAQSAKCLSGASKWSMNSIKSKMPREEVPCLIETPLSLPATPSNHLLSKLHTDITS